MQVSLVSKTSPVIHDAEGQLLSAEQLIVYCARVSNPENQLNTSTAPKLLAFCIRKKHWSPFSMADLTVEVKTSRAIAQQIIRHVSLSVQEFSQRYAVVQASEPIELRRQGSKNRQGGEQLLDDPALDVQVMEHVQNSFALYDKLLAKGASKETARFVLPLSTQTTLYLKGSVRSWIHYLTVREAPDAQKEHRYVAHAIRSIFVEHFPNVLAAVDEILAAKLLADKLEGLIEEYRTCGGALPAVALLDFMRDHKDELLLAMRT